MRLMLAGVIGVAALAGCGPKVEGPFEGEGAYEGQYQTDRSPRGWREDGPPRAQETARRDAVVTPWEPTPAQEAQVPPPAQGAQVPPPEGVSPPAQAEAAPAEQPGAEGYAEEADRVARFDAAIEGMRANIELFAVSDDLAHVELVTALRHLATALEAAPGGAPAAERVREIRAYADRIEGSDPQSMEHADWARAAFGQGVEALTGIAFADGRDITGIDDVRARVENLPVDTGLLRQRVAYADAFRQLGDEVASLGRREQPAGTQ